MTDGCYRCGIPEAIGDDDGRCRWPDGVVVTYHEDLQASGLSRLAIATAYDRAAASWRAVCGIDLRRVADPREARIIARSGPIDGRGNVLAWSELPYNATAATVLNQRYDLPESWSNADQLVACIAHELGHAIGLPHLPGTGALMEPVLVLGRHTPQPPDIAAAVARYGPPDIAASDWAEVARLLRPYVIGPWADGLVAASRAIAAPGARVYARERAYAVVVDAFRATYEALVTPRIARLNDAEAAQALLDLAAALARS